MTEILAYMSLITCHIEGPVIFKSVVMLKEIGCFGFLSSSLSFLGLDVEVDRILEIACVITDGRLNKLVEVSFYSFLDETVG